MTTAALAEALEDFAAGEESEQRRARLRAIVTDLRAHGVTTNDHDESGHGPECIARMYAEAGVTDDRLRAVLDDEPMFTPSDTAAARWYSEGWNRCARDVRAALGEQHVITDDRLRDEPRARLLRAMAEHPNATYVRVEVIDLRAALEEKQT